MKNILVLIHDDAGQEARLQAALDITRAVEGHLTCLDVAIMQVVPCAGLGGDGGAMILEYERVAESANKEKLAGRMAGEDVSWDWIDTCGSLELCLEEAAALSDLIVVNRRFDQFPGPDMGRVAAGLVVRSGKPILAVPDTANGFNAAGAALVAWDGSPAASAALAAAAPLLLLAERVTIVEVDDGSVKTPAEEAASYLSRHGIHPRVFRIAPFGSDGDSASDILLGKAKNGTFDYLVMGGFGHSRFVEALLGGVTRNMLARSPIPLFLAH
jgi:nucleotide-binding universal stress UspA family protein